MANADGSLMASPHGRTAKMRTVCVPFGRLLNV